MRPVVTRQIDGSSIVLDAVLSGDLASSWEVTEHPIEGGGSVTDYSIRRPVEVTLGAILSESPGSDVSSTTGPERIDEVRAWLDASAGSLLTVSIPDRPTVSDCLLTGVRIGIRAERAVGLDVTLRQVQIATATTVEVQPIRGRSTPRGGGGSTRPTTRGTTSTQQIRGEPPAPSASAGNGFSGTADRGTTSTAPATPERKRSTLAAIFGGA